MYEVIRQIINHVWVTNDSMQQYIVYICGALICILLAVILDLVYRVFRSFWHK